MLFLIKNEIRYLCQRKNTSCHNEQVTIILIPHVHNKMHKNGAFNLHLLCANFKLKIARDALNILGAVIMRFPASIAVHANQCCMISLA